MPWLWPRCWGFRGARHSSRPSSQLHTMPGECDQGSSLKTTSSCASRLFKQYRFPWRVQVTLNLCCIAHRSLAARPRSRGVAHAMLDSLTENLVGVFKTLKGQKTINEGNIDDSLRSDLAAMGRMLFYVGVVDQLS